MLVTLMMVKNVKPHVDKYSATHMNGIIGAEQLMSQQIGMTVPQLCQVNLLMLPDSYNIFIKSNYFFFVRSMWRMALKLFQKVWWT